MMQEESRKNWYKSTYERQAKRQAANFESRAEEFQKEKDLFDRIEGHAKRKEQEDKRKEEEEKKLRQKRQQETNDMLKLQVKYVICREMKI